MRLSSLVVPSKWRNVLAGAVVAVLTTIAFLAFFSERRREEQGLQADLEIHAAVRAERILKEIEEYLETLAFLAEWYRVELRGGREAVSPTLTTLVRVLLARNRDLYLFAEARPSAVGTGGIPEYSVAWVEPEGVRPLVVGSDLQRHPIFGSLLPRAIQSRHLEVSTRVPCPDKEGDGYDIWFLQPLLPHVYEEGPLTERSAPVGMLIAVLDIEDTMERTLGEMYPADLAWRLTDESAPPGEEILYASGKPVAPAGGGPAWQTSFPLTSRNSWQLSATPGPLFVDSHLRRRSWWLLAGGLSFSLLVGGLLLVLANQTELVEIQVRERTESLSREIAERLQAESRLRESEGKYRALAENAEDLIYVMGLDERILYANAYAARTAGVRPEELVGAPIASFAPGLSSEERSAMMAQIVAGRAIQQAFPVVFQGRSYWYDLHLVPLKNDAQQITGVLGIGRDITTRKELESQLQKAKEAADAAVRAKSEFLATMSHEIRTPLNGVIGTIGLLLDGPLSKQQREVAGIAHESAGNLLSLVNEILDFSKLEARRLVIEPTPFAPAQVLNEVAALYAATAAGKGLSLQVCPAADVPQRVIGDAGRIRQVLLNLAGNAVKFTERGHILLKVASEGVADGVVRLRFCVEDTGRGITAEQQRRLFERFVQGDASTTRRYGGTGLGLSISRQLVELMGGQIGLESRPGEGAVVWFELALPLDPGQPPLAPAAPDLAEPRPRAAIGPCRVLVAEDNAINQRVAVLVLESLGCRADVAANGVEAVAMAQGFPYDLLLMDCEMPERDGFEAAEEIRRGEAGGGRRLPIVAMTARAGPGERERCLRCGMDDFLTKPVSTGQIADVLARFVPQRESAAADDAPGPEPLRGEGVPGERPALDPRRSAELRRLSGSRDRWEQLALLFEKGVDAQLVRLRERCEAGDVDAVRSAAHKLKGSCVNFGAQEMAACCGRLEESACGASPAGAAAFVAELEAAWGRVQSALGEQRRTWEEGSA